MKPASCMFQPEGTIELPPPEVSNDVDAEGELAIVIGKKCRYVPAENVRDVIFGYTVTLDLTALDVLRKNPRYLTRAKSIDTFFSFGPVIVTADEIPDVDALEVITEHNGQVFSAISSAICIPGHSNSCAFTRISSPSSPVTYSRQDARKAHASKPAIAFEAASKASDRSVRTSCKAAAKTGRERSDKLR